MASNASEIDHLKRIGTTPPRSVGSVACSSFPSPVFCRMMRRSSPRDSPSAVPISSKTLPLVVRGADGNDRRALVHLSNQAGGDLRLQIPPAGLLDLDVADDGQPFFNLL